MDPEKEEAVAAMLVSRIDQLAIDISDSSDSDDSSGYSSDSPATPSQHESLKRQGSSLLRLPNTDPVRHVLGTLGLQRSEMKDITMLTNLALAAATGIGDQAEDRFQRKVRSISQRASANVVHFMTRRVGVDPVQVVKAAKFFLMSEQAWTPPQGGEMPTNEVAFGSLLMSARAFLNSAQEDREANAEGIKIVLEKLLEYMREQDPEDELVSELEALQTAEGVEPTRVRSILLELIKRATAFEDPAAMGNSSAFETDTEAENPAEVNPVSLGLEMPSSPGPNDESLSTMVHSQMARRHRNRNVIRVISDLHLSSHWHTEKSHASLMSVLGEMEAVDTYVSTLVINGDIVERWLAPAEEKPRSAVDMLRDPTASRVVKAIKRVAANGVRIYYLRGNHDDDVTASDVFALFGTAVHFVEGEDLIISGIRFTHGHCHDFVCRPYTHAEHKRPIAYFMSRCAASSGLNEGGATGGYRKVSQNISNRFAAPLFSIFKLRTACHWAIVKVMTVAFQADNWEQIADRRIIMEDGSFVTLQQVMDQYLDIMRTTQKEYGSVKAAAMSRAAISGQLGHFLRRSPYLVDVFSHTHQQSLRSYRRHRPLGARPADEWTPALGSQKPVKAKRRLPTRVVYANTGCFATDMASYVDILMMPAKARVVSRLPTYLFGRSQVRDIASHKTKMKHGAPLDGLQAFPSDASQRIIGTGHEVIGTGALLPYEVRVFKSNPAGGFYLQKAKRVPYEGDWTSRGQWATRHGNKYKTTEEERPLFVTGVEGKVAVPVTGTIRATDRKHLGINRAAWDPAPLRYGAQEMARQEQTVSNTV
ncbi:UDP-23-diacylglucosamine hydrolase [Carpediemonas membranifera]|uniref:UDP-23-diacylglucosamine hydrolase n=1 Tax=Carpediemonas membranifera TaxID=201153 RepID=A0A8J6AYN6_9EUKA|nr:UDP-23-diacylglucosamine hydrolase [Carpediemonas membranifera]|eukprot:KAG9397288.1 UDP-23-diacylglucosamine hydrolase [Carpediemonas membranifera]